MRRCIFAKTKFKVLLSQDGNLKKVMFMPAEKKEEEVSVHHCSESRKCHRQSENCKFSNTEIDHKSQFHTVLELREGGITDNQIDYNCKVYSQPAKRPVVLHNF